MVQPNKLNVTISNRVPSSVTPSKSAELLRDVRLEDGFDIGGSLYAYNLDASGSGICRGSVFARREATLHPPTVFDGNAVNDKPMSFQAGIYAGQVITTEISSSKSTSPVETASHTPLIIRGDVTAPRVRLENAVVVGSVRADNAVIKDSIILGTALVKERLQIDNSVLISYNASQVELAGRNTIIFPYAISDTPPRFDTERTKPAASVPKEDLPGDANEAWVRYLGLCFAETGCGGAEGLDAVAIACERHLTGSCPYTDVRVRTSDVRTTSRSGGESEAFALTLVDRLMNTEEMYETLDDITTILRTASYFNNFDDSAKEMFKVKYENNTSPLISMLYGIIKHSIEETS